MKRVAAITILILAAMTAFAQGVRVDIPLWTSGPSVPVSGGPLPQSLLLANSTVNICVHPATASSCTPITTYTDTTLATPCPTNSPVVQLPGTACVATTGPRGNLGFWYSGGVVDYFVHSSYGNFGPFTTSGGSTGPTGPQGPPGTPANISGQTTNFVPLASSATSLTSPSHINESTAGTTAVTQNLSVTGTVQSNSIGSSPSTSPICPNGTGGALTTSGCAAGSGTVSGQANGVVPLATASTTITAQSHLDDGITSTGTITSSENVNLPSAIASAQPLLNIRHPSFSGGAICDGTTSNDIGAALQAAYSSLPASGGEILIPGSPASCYWSNPAAFNYSGHNYVTFFIQGTLRTGTTWTIPSGFFINIIGKHAAAPNQFLAPGQIAALTANPASGTALGTLGTAVAATYTGTGDPTSSLPVVCNSSVSGNIYNDTNGASAEIWQCVATTGSITATTPTLTVANIAGISPGDTLNVAGAGAAGGTLVSKVLSINTAASTVTLNNNASTTVSGNAVSINLDFFAVAPKFGWKHGATVTITPSNMNGFQAGTNNTSQGSAITISDSISCNINTISRTSNVVTATFSSACHVPPGTHITIAGVSDSSFNATNLILRSSDYVTNTMTWAQTASNSSSSGGTVSSWLNEDTVETVQITSTTSTTATANFYRLHASTSQWAMVGLNLNNNTAASLIQDLVISAGGTVAWLEQSYKSEFVNVGISANGGCVNQPSFPVEYYLTGYTTFSGVSMTGGCLPWSIRLTQPYSTGYAGSGGLTIANASVFGDGIKLDHGGEGVVIKDSFCEQCARGVISFDPSRYWATVVNNINLTNASTQDNPNNFTTCNFYALSSTVNAQISITQATGYASCSVNDYFLGQFKTDTVLKPDLLASRGPFGNNSTGISTETEIRGAQASMGPSVIPGQTANINTSPSSWPTGGSNCTVASGTVGPDGSTTAGTLTSASALGSVVGFMNISSPAVGDMILFGGWVYTPTLGQKAQAGPSGTAFQIDNNNNNTNFTIAYGNSFNNGTGSAVNTNAFDLGTADDWWHPLVGFAQVTVATGSAGRINLTLACDSLKTMEYWRPWIMYLPASSYSLAEGMRIRAQLMHGAVPTNFNEVGVPATSETISAGGYQVNGTALATGNLSDWTNASVANGNAPIWNSGTSKWTPGSVATSTSGLTDWSNSGASVTYVATCQTVVSGSCTSWAPAQPSGGTVVPYSSISPQFNASQGWAATNGTILGQVFTTDVTVNVNDLCYNIRVADNTSNVYDLGIRNQSTGNLVLHLGATAGTTVAPSTGFKCLAISGGPISLIPGTYVAEVTSNCASACATFSNALVAFIAGFASAYGSGTAGTLPSSQTLPGFGYIVVGSGGLWLGWHN